MSVAFRSGPGGIIKIPRCTRKEGLVEVVGGLS